MFAIVGVVILLCGSGIKSVKVYSFAILVVNINFFFLFICLSFTLPRTSNRHRRYEIPFFFCHIAFCCPFSEIFLLVWLHMTVNENKGKDIKMNSFLSHLWDPPKVQDH